MKLDPRALAYAGAVLFGGTALFIGMANLSSPHYGTAFLALLSSVCPGYHADRTIQAVLVGVGYALVEGAGAGWVFGWLYNRLVQQPPQDGT